MKIKLIVFIIVLIMMWPLYSLFEEVALVDKAENQTSDEYDACLENASSPKCEDFIDGNETADPN